MNTHQPAPRGRPRQFDRDQALDQAMLLFWTYGYEAASVAQLAHVMGVNPPSLYAAFGDKRRLFFEAVDHYVDKYGGFIAAALAEEPTAQRAVRRLLLEAAQNYTRPESPHGCMVLSAAVNCGSGSEDVITRLAGRRKSMLDAIEARLAQSAALGELAAHADVEALATYIVTVLYGLSTAARDGLSTATLCRTVNIAMGAWPRTDATS